MRAAIFLLLLAIFFPAQASETNGILFLRLRMTTNDVQLVDAKPRNGRYKPELTKGQLDLEMRDAKGALLFTTPLQDPLVTRFEYEDPAEPGKMLVKEVRQPAADFVVRVPKREGAKKVRLFRKIAGQPGLLTAQSTRELVGEFDLPGEAPK